MYYQQRDQSGYKLYFYSGPKYNLFRFRSECTCLEHSKEKDGQVCVIHFSKNAVCKLILYFRNWKVGNEKLTAILAIPESNQLLTAAKNVKLWDIEAKEVLRTFTGHKSEVTFLHFLCPQSSGESYFISGSRVSWKISETI